MDNQPANFDSSIPAQLRERYTDFKFVGQGGMGRIVSAIDIVLDKPVAIKILPPTVVSETAVTRFQIEAKARKNIQLKISTGINTKFIQSKTFSLQLLLQV